MASSFIIAASEEERWLGAQVMMTSVLLLFDLTWSAGEGLVAGGQGYRRDVVAGLVTVDRDGNKTEPFGPNPLASRL